jgi:PleD family two-component response regulator
LSGLINLSSAFPVFDDLFGAADRAMYRAKHADRNRVVAAGA